MAKKFVLWKVSATVNSFETEQAAIERAQELASKTEQLVYVLEIKGVAKQLDPPITYEEIR